MNYDVSIGAVSVQHSSFIQQALTKQAYYSFNKIA